jgi:hypothetical protein
MQWRYGNGDRIYFMLHTEEASGCGFAANTRAFRAVEEAEQPKVSF